MGSGHMSLYNIGMFILAKASWIMKPLYTISLFLDGVIYSVVSYVYKIYMLKDPLNIMIAPNVNENSNYNDTNSSDNIYFYIFSFFLCI